MEYEALKNPEESLAQFGWTVIEEDGKTMATGRYPVETPSATYLLLGYIHLWERIWGHDLESIVNENNMLILKTTTHDIGNKLSDRDFLLINSISNLWTLFTAPE